eukprot:5479456-Amphidinium_carterae.5
MGDVINADQGPPKRPLVPLPPLEAPCGIYPRYFLTDKYPPDAPNAPIETDLLTQFEESEPEQASDLEDFQNQHQLFQMVSTPVEETPLEPPIKEIELDPVPSSSAAATPPMVKAPPPSLVEQLTSSSATIPVPAP